MALTITRMQNQQIQLNSNIGNMHEFVELVVEMINNIIYNWSYILIPADHRGILEVAWEQCLDDMDRVDWDVELSPQGMASVGLTGAQLAVKFQLLNRAVGDFIVEGAVDRILDVLDWINKILGSASIAAPGLEPIKEMKEIIEGIIKRL